MNKQAVTSKEIAVGTWRLILKVWIGLLKLIGWLSIRIKLITDSWEQSAERHRNSLRYVQH